MGTSAEEADGEPATGMAENGDVPVEGEVATGEATGGEAPAGEAGPVKRRKRKKKARPAAPVTFAGYLAQLLVVDQGFCPGGMAEAEELARVSDHVLTRVEGNRLTIACILDAERDPARTFAIAADRLVVIAMRCLPYTHSAEGVVAVRLIEVREGLRAEDRERLSDLCREHAATALASLDVRACVIARGTREVWSTLGWMEERFYKRALTEPRRSDDELVPRKTPQAPHLLPAEPPIAAPSLRGAPPWLTCGILALTGLLFAGELSAGVGPANGGSPSLDTLVAMGGVSRSLVMDQGEWWRLFTAPMLHAGVAHLLFNGVALFLGGLVLERLFGRAWLGAIFVASALGGSLLSITINDPGVISVGASGAIMGLLAAAMVASYRVPSTERRQIQLSLGRILIPSLIPIATSTTGEHVDFAAHLGGAAVGVALGLLLLDTWPAGQSLPRFRRAALAVASVGLLLFGTGVARSASAYAGYRDAASVQLIPKEQIESLQTADAEALLARYPRDPRAHWLAATRAANAKDLPGAEAHLRAALAEEAVLRHFFPNRKLEAALRATLARVLDAEGRRDAAFDAARPACDLKVKELEPYCGE